MWRQANAGLALALVLIVGVGNWAGAEEGDKPETITDVSKAGPDYQMQGEYEGAFDIGDGNTQSFGMHVISLGDNKFHGVGYVGGLPGAGWDGFTRIEVDGELADGEVKFMANEGSATLKDGEVIVAGPDGAEIGKLKKVERKSETLGMAPPEGAIVLFDGKNADAWEGGKVADGLLSGGCKSKQKFQDFTLHVEFRTPYMPSARGQARGNSGVYVQDRYEVQVLDSFGLEGLNNECGGIYSLKDPRENMCYPPLTWQTYDIDFTAAKFDGDKKTANATITCRHNGVIIYENYELQKETPGGQPESAAAGQIQLQDHGNPVVYRNIWIVEKK
ncbi:MAG: DUF1080 domain-containing protein [Pirellulales bacterium]|nr:DUF1080 domain-containing protein [Pirellulales bacterium]